MGYAVDMISSTGNFIAGLLMLLVSLVICYEAVMRHFFNMPTTWVMALSLLAFMWFPFLSVAYGIKAGKHVSCDVLVSRLPTRTQAWIGIATDISTLFYIVALGVYGIDQWLESYQIGSMSVGAVRYPLWVLRLAFPAGMFACLLQTLRKILLRFDSLRNGDLESGTGFSSQAGVMLLLYLSMVAGGILVFSVHQPFGILILALVLLLWGVPIAFGLGLVGIVGLLVFHGSMSGLYTLPIVAEKTVHNFVLLAIPLFSLGGVILARSGLGEQIYDLSAKWSNWLPGGLGVATCVTGGVLAAMIGSSTAVTAIVTLVAMKPLLDRGYDKTLVIGTVTGSSLGLIIPPSIGFIVYGFLTDTSVGALFMAGFIPGIMRVVMFSLYVIITCKVTGQYKKIPYSWGERLYSLRKSFLIVLGPAFVLGSIYSGLATPTEAGAILVIYSIFCTLIYRRMNWGQFFNCLMESSTISTMILMIMVGALTMSNVVTLLQIPTNLTEAIVHSGLPHFILIMLLIIFYMILGMFLDGGSITVLTVPVLAPMLPALGIDTVVFGVVLMILIETALLTPPVGLNIFTVKGIVDEPLSLIIRSVFPFVIILLLAAMLCLVFPQLSLWLPSLMMK